jgi:glycosyltransferase involved in cell wall biosynthesis
MSAVKRYTAFRSITTGSKIFAVLPTIFWRGWYSRTIKMKILYCNKYNYRFSGTESYLFELMRRVEERGHETALFSMDHGEVPAFAGRSYLIPHCDFKDRGAGLAQKVRMAAHALYSPSSRRRMRECLRDYSPDVAHIRGIYHHLSPSILWELKRQDVPVLYHINDFKLLCPAYNLVSKGQACEECFGGKFFHVATADCYAGPLSSAVVLAVEAYLHRWLRTYERCVDLFLAPSRFVRQKLVENGFPGDRVEVLAHFQHLPAESSLKKNQGYALYFGRLSSEKGVAELLRTLTLVPHVPLVIAGDGPERRCLEWLARDLNLCNVSFTGKVIGSELDQLIAEASFSVFPSQAYETLGKSILESYAWGRPVIASDLGSRRELVEDGVTGLLYPLGDREQLAKSIETLFRLPDLAAAMGRAARERVRQKHDPERHLDVMQEIYSRLMASKRRAATTKSAPTSPSRRRIRVAFIGGRGLVSKYSGIESYYEQAGRELAELGHEVTIYCRTYFTPPINEHHGMRIVRLPTIRSKHLETLLHTALSTVHAMFSGCDVVHYHALGPALFSFLPRITGKKTVVTVQGLDWQRRKWGVIAARVLRLGEAASAFFPNATMVVSQALRQYYQQRYGRPVAYIANGTELTTRRTPNHLAKWRLIADAYVLYLGRLSPEKNCHLLIDAFENVRSEMTLVLAGGSSHSDAYIEGLRRHESERIRFLPWVSGEDLEELVSNAALFVLPSDLEGMSLALLEAMGAGVCVLTSDIPENKEVVAGAGFTFQRGDQLDLEAMLDLLLCNPELRAQAGTRARQRIAGEFLWPGIARSIEKVYYEVLGWQCLEQHPSQPVVEESSGRNEISAA